MMSMYPINRDVNFFSARLLYWSITIFPFVTSILWGDNFETMQIPCYSSNFNPFVLAPI